MARIRGNSAAGAYLACFCIALAHMAPTVSSTCEDGQFDIRYLFNKTLHNESGEGDGIHPLLVEHLGKIRGKIGDIDGLVRNLNLDGLDLSGEQEEKGSKTISDTIEKTFTFDVPILGPQTETISIPYSFDAPWDFIVHYDVTGKVRDLLRKALERVGMVNITFSSDLLWNLMVDHMMSEPICFWCFPLKYMGYLQSRLFL